MHTQSTFKIGLPTDGCAELMNMTSSRERLTTRYCNMQFAPRADGGAKWVKHQSFWYNDSVTFLHQFIFLSGCVKLQESNHKFRVTFPLSKCESESLAMHYRV